MIKRRFLFIFFIALLFTMDAHGQDEFRGLDTPPQTSPVPAETGDTTIPAYRRVIVAIDTGRATGIDMGIDMGQFRSMDEPSAMAVIASAQETLLQSLSAYAVRDVTRFRYIPFVAMTVDAAGFDALQRSRYVTHIEEDRYAAPMLDTAATIIGASGSDGAWDFGYDGKGQVVAVLDTGIDKNHPALAGQIIKEACFSTNGTLFDRNGNASTATSLCPDGAFESFAPDSALNCPASIDNCDHGTLISGTIASKDATYRGIAPAAKVIALQVFTRVDGGVCPVDWGFASPCVLSLTSDQIRALEYLYSIRDSYNLAAITLSLGADFWSSEAQCDADNFARKAIVDLLRNAGIMTFSPTGNTGLSDQMIAPACISSVIAVSATDDTDAVAGFSNTTTFMDFFAPGQNIHSLVPGGGFADKSGTSMATPITVGAWVLLRQANKSLSNEVLYNVLASTGKPIAHNGIFSPRIDLKAALPQVTVLLRAPQKVATVTSAPLDFVWDAMPHPDVVSYKLIIKNTRTGDKIVKLIAPETCTTTCTQAIDEMLVNGDTYFWKVKASRSDTSKFKSLKRWFTVHYPDVPHLIQPSDDVVLTDAGSLTVFEWSPVVSVLRYKLIVKDLTTGAKILKEVIMPPCGETCVYSVPQAVRDALVDGHTYKWKVKAYFPTYRTKSARWHFITGFTP